MSVNVINESVHRRVRRDWVRGCEAGCPGPARYASVAVIDMDSIELSNINRQFLYSRDDVGREKAHVTADYLRAKAPSLRVNSYSETVINPKRFGPSFSLNMMSP